MNRRWPTVGKIVANALVTDWRYDDVHPLETTIRFTDGSELIHRYEDYGTRDYPEHCVDVDYYDLDPLAKSPDEDTTKMDDIDQLIWGIINYFAQDSVYHRNFTLTTIRHGSLTFVMKCCGKLIRKFVSVILSKK